MVEKQSEAFHTFLWHFYPSLKQNFIAYRSSQVSSRPDCIFEIHQLWQSCFSRVYSSCCCSCSFKPEIIIIGRSSYKMYSNNKLNFQESRTILNPCPKSLEIYWRHHVYDRNKVNWYYIEKNSKDRINGRCLKKWMWNIKWRKNKV